MPRPVRLEALQTDVLPRRGGARCARALPLLVVRAVVPGARVGGGHRGGLPGRELHAHLPEARRQADVGEPGRLIPWKPAENAPAGWQSLPRAAILMVVVGLLSRWIGLLAARYLPERYWWGASSSFGRRAWRR